MNKILGRNDVCHCGSGKKYKACHGLSNNQSFQKWAIIGALVLVVLWLLFYESEPAVTNNFSSPVQQAPPGKVWSEEHNHWHDAPAQSSTPAPTPASNKLIPQPEGDAPPGKVWSPEHGHWHDKQ